MHLLYEKYETTWIIIIQCTKVKVIENIACQSTADTAWNVTLASQILRHMNIVKFQYDKEPWYYHLIPSNHTTTVL